MKIKIIFADSWQELTPKMMGYYHDHCHHLYTGKTEDVMDDYRYKDLMVDIKDYCFIYEEDEPYIPKENG